MEITTHTEVLSRFGHALSDPTRTRLLLALRGGPGHPAELAEQLGVSRQGLSNHLTCLRGCGLVVAEQEGCRVRYELADPSLARALIDLLAVVLMAAAGLGAGPGASGARDGLVRRVRLLVAANITYNVGEAVVALAAGGAASSSALVGFGLDSLVEVPSAAAVAWQFAIPDHRVREAREHRAPARDGRNAWRGDGCCAPSAAALLDGGGCDSTCASYS